ncbi:MAG: decarboxylase [Desulfurococcaceae archaeon]|jgi:arginine decarboxylase
MRGSKDFLEAATRLYGIENYVRGGFIRIDDDGYLVIVVNGEKIRIKEIMDSAGLDVAYIRVLPLIEKAMSIVYESFEKLSKELGYRGALVPLYPMKVNPTPIVVDAVFKYGEKYGWGFNAGSIGEVRLLKQLSAKYSPRMLIYDGVVTSSVLDELVDLKNRGWRVVVDIESDHDAEILSSYPELEAGLRVKPLVKLCGKWHGSVGLGSKFGVTTNAIAKLKSDYKWLTERATVLHMHPGSQIYRLRDLKNYFSEVRQVYAELKNMGFENLVLVDPGGGMAYPYLDTREGSEESPDYTIDDYFRELLAAFSSVDPSLKLAFEGGRFIVAAHRLVVAKVIDVRPYSAVDSNGESSEKLVEEVKRLIEEVDSYEDAEKLLGSVKSLLTQLKKSVPLDGARREVYEELVKLVREDFAHKLASLVKTGQLDCRELLNHKALARLLTSPTKRFVLNMSIFADIPDAVLVDQYFQVVPAHRLNEPPDVLAVISDLTCDSMGELKEFISASAGRGNDCVFTRLDSRLILAPNTKLKLKGVPLHLPAKNENYYLVFLDTGAYQDTLAMKHNLIYGAPEVVIDYNERSGKVEVRVMRHEELYT